MITDTTSTALVLSEDAQRLLFVEARSNVNFMDREVSPDVIREAFDLVKWAPTGNNSVPMRVAIASSPEARAAVIAAAVAGNRPKLEQAPLLLVVARDERFHDYFDTTAPGSQAVAARLEEVPEERALRAERGTWLQAGYFIIGLRAAGLAVRPYGGFDDAAVNEALFAASPWRAQVLMGVGYPTDNHGAGPRKGRVGSELAVTEL